MRGISLPEYGMFDDLQPPTPEEALVGLSDSLDNLIQLSRRADYVPQHMAAAQEEAFIAVHDYAEALDIADDEEGMAFRLDLARALNEKIQNGINPLRSQIEFNPVDFVDKARRAGVLDESPDEHMSQYFQRLAGPSIAGYNDNVTVAGDAYDELNDLGTTNQRLANDWLQ